MALSQDDSTINIVVGISLYYIIAQMLAAMPAAVLILPVIFVTMYTAVFIVLYCSL